MPKHVDNRSQDPVLLPLGQNDIAGQGLAVLRLDICTKLNAFCHVVGPTLLTSRPIPLPARIGHRARP